MYSPIRGEFWLSDLKTTQGRGQVTTGRHPVLISSQDSYNQFRNRLTVLLLTGVEYETGRFKGKQREELYGLEVTQGDFDRGALSKRSFILCDQLATISARRTSGADLRWGRGALACANADVMTRVARTLSEILSEDPASIDNLDFRQGDVLQLCSAVEGDETFFLVLSSDRFRLSQLQKVYRPRSFVVVVPLIPDPGPEIQLAPIMRLEGSDRSRTHRAICMEVFTLDTGGWPCRRIGRVADVSVALNALRLYLGVVMGEEKKAGQLPQHEDADQMAASAEATRDLTDRLGIMFREMHVGLFRRLDDEDGSGEDLFAPTGESQEENPEVLDNRSMEREQSPSRTFPGPVWYKLIEGAKKSAGWLVGLGEVRCSFDLSSGGFHLTAGGAAEVLGSQTQTYEYDLFHILEELGVKEEFESFKLICKTGDARTAVGATLVRRRGADDVGSPLEFSLYLSGPEPIGREAKRRKERSGQDRVRIDLHPYKSSGSTFVTFDEIENPTDFLGRLEIRIREVDPVEEDEAD